MQVSLNIVSQSWQVFVASHSWMSLQVLHFLNIHTLQYSECDNMATDRYYSKTEWREMCGYHITCFTILGGKKMLLLMNKVKEKYESEIQTTHSTDVRIPNCGNKTTKLVFHDMCNFTGLLFWNKIFTHHLP